MENLSIGFASMAPPIHYHNVRLTYLNCYEKIPFAAGLLMSAH